MSSRAKDGTPASPQRRCSDVQGGGTRVRIRRDVGGSDCQSCPPSTRDDASELVERSARQRRDRALARSPHSWKKRPRRWIAIVPPRDLAGVDSGRAGRSRDLLRMIQQELYYLSVQMVASGVHPGFWWVPEPCGTGVVCVPRCIGVWSNVLLLGSVADQQLRADAITWRVLMASARRFVPAIIPDRQFSGLLFYLVTVVYPIIWTVHDLRSYGSSGSEHSRTSAICMGSSDRRRNIAAHRPESVVSLCFVDGSRTTIDDGTGARVAHPGVNQRRASSETLARRAGCAALWPSG